MSNQKETFANIRLYRRLKKCRLKYKIQTGRISHEIELLYQQDPHGELTNQNVLIVYGTLEETAEHFGFTVESTKAYLKEALDILYKAREKRPRPHLDDKIVTAWNGIINNILILIS